MAENTDEKKDKGVDISAAPKGTQTSEAGSETGGESQTGEDRKNETGNHEGGSESGEGGAGDGEGEDEDSINPDTGQPYTAEEWRDKFRASAQGANKLLTEKKTLENEIAKVKADSDLTLKEKDEEIKRLRDLAEGKNPDGLKLSDLARENKETKDQLVRIQENTLLDGFLSGTKIDGAADFKEALRALSRANPQASLQELWDKNLKAGAEAAAVAKKGRDTTRREGASDSGRGASSRERSADTVKGPKGDTGLTQEEFDKLPVSKRRELFIKVGL